MPEGLPRYRDAFQTALDHGCNTADAGTYANCAITQNGCVIPQGCKEGGARRRKSRRLGKSRKSRSKGGRRSRRYKR